MYLTSPGRPTNIALQLDKTCYSCSRLGERGNVFISSVSLPVFSSLSCLYLSSHLLFLLSLFSLSLRDDTK